MKTVLVTGGTKRLGLAIAKELKSRGWRVITSSHRPDSGADLIADLSQEGEAEWLFNEAVKLARGKLDAIVNNAALFTGEEKAVLEIDSGSPMTLMKLLSSTPGASVVNIVDTRALGLRFGEGNAYKRAKRLLVEATAWFAEDSKNGFRANAVAPGPVLAPEGVHEKAGPIITPRPTPEDVASAVAFLLETPSVTGAVIPVDGGQHLLRRPKENL